VGAPIEATPRKKPVSINSIKAYKLFFKQKLKNNIYLEIFHIFHEKISFFKFFFEKNIQFYFFLLRKNIQNSP